MCDGDYPKTFDEVSKTLSTIRKMKYGKNPTNGTEILEEFQKEHISKQLGFSLLKDGAQFFNGAVITDKFENCFFSSRKCIDLIIENVSEAKRFFILDGTFRITPKGIWQQVLILHGAYKLKVRQIILIIFQQ